MYSLGRPTIQIAENSDGSVTLSSTQTGQAVTVLGPGQLQGNPLSQTEWAIAPVTGNDNAEGTLDAPLRTGAEFTRRTLGRPIDQSTRLSILEAFPDPFGDYIHIDSVVSQPSGFLMIDAPNVAPILAGPATITARTNQVANVSQTTIQASVDLSSYVGKRLRILSSATAPTNTIAFIEAFSAGTATLSSPCFVDTADPSGFWSSTTIRQLSVGDTFVIDDPIQCCQLSARLVGPFEYSGVAMAEHGGIRDLRLGAGYDTLTLAGLQAYACMLNVGYFTSNDRVMGCHFNNTFNAMNLEGQCFMSFCSIEGAVTTSEPNSEPTFLLGNSIRGGRYIMQGSGAVTINNSGTNSGLGMFQWTTGSAIHVQEGCFCNLEGRLWGTSTVANTFGIRVDAYAGAAYNSGRKPTISGTLAPTKDVEVGGTSLAYSAVPASSAISTNFAALVAKN